MICAVEVLGLWKSYAGHPVVKDVNLSVASGEFFTLLGSSGSGKTTTLMTVAGFIKPDRGEIRIDGRSVVSLLPEKRNLGVVFQSYALFPHMTVAQNVGFPLRIRGLDRRAVSSKVENALQLVDLAGLGGRRISQLSGGQQQRVALARALVFEPPVLLMDEPLGALDRKLRDQLQGELKRIQQTLGVTVVYVTHDQEEALALSNRIAVMDHGEVVQVGHPAEVYERPRSVFVAKFLGESNIMDVNAMPSTDGGSTLILSGQGTDRLVMRSSTSAEGPVQLMVRPESIRVGPPDTSADEAIPGTVSGVQYLGASLRYVVDTAVGAIIARCARTADAFITGEGERVALSWRPSDARLFSSTGQALVEQSCGSFGPMLVTNNSKRRE